MAVPEQTPFIEYTANGTTTVYPLTFDCDKSEYLIVSLDGEEAPVGSWSLAGGSITFNSAPANGVVITIERNTPFQRTTNYQLYDNSFRPSAVNKDFDLIWWKLQELGYRDQVIWLALLQEIENRKLGDDELVNYIKIQIDYLKQDYINRDDALKQDYINRDNALKNYIDQMIALITGDPSFNGITTSFIKDVITGKTQEELNKNIFDEKGYAVSSKIITHGGRTQAQKNIETVSVRDFGAIGDGTLHKLQEWVDSGKYASLAAIKLDYPFVTSLDQSIDWAATQKAVLTGTNTYAPQGTYVLSDTVHTPHSGSSFRVDSGRKIYGDGCLTFFTRNQIAVASNDDDLNNNEACFSVHGSYFYIEYMAIINSKIGIYYGQDLTKTELSNCYKSAIRNVEIRNTSIGLLMSSSGGNHYNIFDNIHFIQCQIDCLIRKGAHDPATSANNNRNTFSNIRSARSYVGFWNKHGDTNTLLQWHGEGVTASPSNNPYPPPPDVANSLTCCVFIIEGTSQLNRLAFCHCEDCDVELFNNSFANSFVNNSFHEYQAGGTKVYFIQEPRLFLSPYTFITPVIKQIANTNANAFPGLESGSPAFLGTKLKHWTSTVEHKNPAHLRGSYKTDVIYELGPQAAQTVVPLSVWGDIDPSSAATIKITVSAIVTGTPLSYSSQFVLNAYRTSSRSLTRYFLTTVLGNKATGPGVGDSTSVISGTLTTGGPSGRELILNLTLPNYAFDNITIYSERLVTKA
ncbi:hypothetical protein JH094_001919 [Acinetobacter baumannii]|uniref:hypothetical protein n=1 Tax=Acinetobacter baumannii TaxID=470 RepID=UPI003B24088F